MSSRQFKKGYFVKGQFVAYGSEVDAQLQREQKGDALISKTDLKQSSQNLQQLGQALEALSVSQLVKLELSEQLVDAISDAKRISDFEGKRRQRQFVGKLMRKLEESDIARAQAAVDELHRPNAEQTLKLHEIEHWRSQLMESDDAFSDWMVRFPSADSQYLRSIIRQARKENKPNEERGKAVRQGAAYRDLFQIIKAALSDED